MNTSPKIRIKTIALPTEHGGWGFLAEPILLGLLVAPAIAGACYALAACSAFLARHPLKLAARHAGEIASSRRYRLAAFFAVVYTLLSIAAFAAAVIIAGWKPVLPIVLLSPFALVFLFYDSRHEARNLLAEISGPLGLAATAPAITLAAGWTWAPSFALWVILMARALPSIVYVRARLRIERGRPTSRPVVWAWHAVFAGVAVLLVGVSLSPWSVLPAFAVLCGRAMLGLSSHRRLTRARQVGLAELFFGLLYVSSVAAGYMLES